MSEIKFEKTYCHYVIDKGENDLHRIYHDSQYGFPLDSDDELFGRLIMEINQAGLNWLIILKKADNFRKAFDDFSIDAVANYDERDRDRLLSDSGIIRNKLKVNAAIENAKAIQNLRASYGSFKSWLDHHHPLSKDEWVKLFKKTFKFTGGEITNEFLMSTGYLKGAHHPDCPVYNAILRYEPAWKKV